MASSTPTTCPSRTTGAATTTCTTSRATAKPGTTMHAKHFDTIVIGAGQAGLAAGYYLARQGRDFVIPDGNSRPGETWRKRWDSLRLFTPAKFNGLDGMPFPAHRNAFVTKDQMADYLERYAQHWDLAQPPDPPRDARAGAHAVRHARRASAAPP